MKIALLTLKEDKIRTGIICLQFYEDNGKTILDLYLNSEEAKQLKLELTKLRL